MSEEICDIIIQATNRKARKCYYLEYVKTSTREQHAWKDVTKNEFDEYFDILLFSGVTHSGYVHSKDFCGKQSQIQYVVLQSVFAVSLLLVTETHASFASKVTKQQPYRKIV